jgi:hypothetical protein
MMRTLLSSFIGVTPFKMLLFKNKGNVGGAGRLSEVTVAALARANLGESSGASRSRK